MISDDKPPRQAVALVRDGGDGHRVVARGYGDLAERIIAEACRQGVYVHNAPELVALLMQLDLDQRIPERLYLAVAELLLWLRDLETNAQAFDSQQRDESPKK